MASGLFTLLTTVLKHAFAKKYQLKYIHATVITCIEK